MTARKQKAIPVRVFTPDTMTKAERSCLVYIETRVVDHGGMLETIRMDEDDWAAIEVFKAAGIVEAGRIPFKLLSKNPGHEKNSHWSKLSDAGWTLAWTCRRYRSFQENLGDKERRKRRPFANAVHKEVARRAAERAG